MNVTKRNHYLPKFYLQNFVHNTKDGTFWVYYKGDKYPKPQTPINTGIEKNLYNIKRENGSVDDSIEQALSIIEGTVSPIIDRLVNSNARLEEKYIPEFALFLSFMATRVPRSIEAAREIGKVYSIHLLKELGKKPDELQELLDKAGEEIEIPKDFTVKEFQKHIGEFEDRYEISFDKKYATGISFLSTFPIFQELMNMNWCLCRAPSNFYFITSDFPLVCFVLNDDGTAKFGGGFGLPDAEVTFPLSPTKCLYLVRKQTQSYRAINKNLLKEINNRTAWAAEKFIISHIKTDYVVKLNDWASDSFNLPKMDKEILFERFQKMETLNNNNTY